MGWDHAFLEETIEFLGPRAVSLWACGQSMILRRSGDSLSLSLVVRPHVSKQHAHTHIIIIYIYTHTVTHYIIPHYMAWTCTVFPPQWWLTRLLNGRVDIGHATQRSQHSETGVSICAPPQLSARVGGKHDWVTDMTWQPWNGYMTYGPYGSGKGQATVFLSRK